MLVKMQHATYLCTKNCKFTTGIKCDYHKLSQKIDINCLLKKNEDRILLRIALATILENRNSLKSISIYRQSMQNFRVRSSVDQQKATSGLLIGIAR